MPPPKGNPTPFPPKRTNANHEMTFAKHEKKTPHVTTPTHQRCPNSASYPDLFHTPDLARPPHSGGTPLVADVVCG